MECHYKQVYFSFENAFCNLLDDKLHYKYMVPLQLYDLMFTYCPPPFRRKAEGHSFQHSVLPSVFPSFRPPNIVGTLCAQLLLQFYADSFETLQMFLSWSEDMHVVWILS